MFYNLSEPFVFIPNSPVGVIPTSQVIDTASLIKRLREPWSLSLTWWLSQMYNVFTSFDYLQTHINSSCIEQPELGVERGAPKYVILHVYS